jgi:hypothetical protein
MLMAFAIAPPQQSMAGQNCLKKKAIPNQKRKTAVKG